MNCRTLAILPSPAELLRLGLPLLALPILALSVLACAPAAEPPADDATTAPAGSPSTEDTALGYIETVDPALTEVISEDATIETLAEGFDWSEGPLWVPDAGYLLFSDVPRNVIYRWREDAGIDTWMSPSGYTGEIPRGGEPGSNGLVLDPEGRLLLCQHGDRRVARLEGPWPGEPITGPTFSTVADRYDGARFHSPNDLVVGLGGEVFFTDPPYGLAEGPDDPSREMPHQGVYRVGADGTVDLISDQLSRPNGVALSPDGGTLYVANSDPERAVWWAFTLSREAGGRVTADGGRLFADATPHVGDDAPGLPDGMAVDVEGRLFATGPGGVWVLTPDGRHLGTVRLPMPAANCTFGDDGSSLFVTADSHLLRVRLQTRGLGFGGDGDVG